MKLVFGLLVFSSMAFAQSGFLGTEGNPTVTDISVNTLIDYHCSKTGDFNPAACQEEVSKCYSKVNWPKTVEVFAKLDVANGCIAKFRAR